MIRKENCRIEQEKTAMQNFTFYAPTEVIFGKCTELEAGKMIQKYHGTKALIVYGNGSVVRSGLLETVNKALDESGISYAEWGGVQPNPRLSHAQAGVAYAVKEDVDFILAVGGGSSIDTAKAIAHGAANVGVDLWDIWSKKYTSKKALPVGVVLTISAAGSEMSDSAVLTNEKQHKKSGLSTPLNRPKFAIMNPELTYSLPKYQIACGVADIMMHTLERYFIPYQKNRMTDEIAEGLLRTVIDCGRIAVNDPTNYDAMSELMWCGSLSHNDLTGLGRAKDFCVHKFGHALSARFDVAHGASLTTMWGDWANYVCSDDLERFQHYGKAVWGIETEDSQAAAKEAIEKTVAYFKEIGMPTCLSELGVGILEEQTLKKLSLDATMGGTIELSQIRKLNAEDVYHIFCAANR